MDETKRKINMAEAKIAFTGLTAGNPQYESPADKPEVVFDPFRNRFDIAGRKTDMDRSRGSTVAG